MRGFRLCLCAIIAAGSLTAIGAHADDTALAKARENYKTYCAKCHGEEGNGKGPGAAMLNPKPRDYTDCKTMQQKPDEELSKVIKEGGEAAGMSADMQSWGGTLSDQEIHDLVKFIRTFCKPS